MNTKHDYYSKVLDKCDVYICAYMGKNKHLKSYKEAYEEIVIKEDRQFKALENLQKIYYELLDRKEIAKFGRELKDLGFYNHEYTFASVLRKSFANRSNLSKNSVIDKYELIISEYEGWKKINKGD